MQLIRRLRRITLRWSGSASHGALIGVVGASLALTGLAGCGAKPKPKPPVATTSAASADPTSGGPEAPERPAERTRGGVDLTSALDSAGAARDDVFLAAQTLSKDRPAGVAELIANKEAAKATVLALFESKNLDELIGALLVVQADGDPTGARAEGSEHVFALLDHEVGAVRDTAWETAAKVADGAGLAKLLPTLAHDKALAVVRLLAAWDGEPVQLALWQLVSGSDQELAIEAALALSARGKRAAPQIGDRLQILLKHANGASLRLGLIVYRRFGHDPKEVISPAMKDAIDRALTSKDEPLVLEGVRSTLVLPAEERAPLYEQLALDPRPAVRAVTAEMLARQTKPDGSAVTLLDKLLTDAEGDVRMAATRARAQLGTPEERLKVIGPLLSDSHRGVRLAAALSLAQPDLITLGLPILLKQLEREDHEASKVILGALSSSTQRAVLLTVIELIGGADSKRVVAAHFALTTATKQDFGVDIGAWKGWLDKQYPPPPEPAADPGSSPGTAPKALLPGTEPKVLLPGTEKALLPGTEPKALLPGTEPKALLPGTEPKAPAPTPKAPAPAPKTP